MPRKVKTALPFAPLAPKQAQGFINLDKTDITDDSFGMQDSDGWQYHWNVTRAIALAEREGTPFCFYPAQVGLTTEVVQASYPDIDPDYALTTDLSNPLILTLFRRHLARADERPQVQLLDGWHRLYKALTLGVTMLPANLLTEEQGRQVLFALLPPGEGVSLTEKQGQEGQEGKTHDR